MACAEHPLSTASTPPTTATGFISPRALSSC